MSIDKQLTEYFGGVSRFGLADSDLNLLGREAAEALTHGFEGLALMDLLDGLVLDDPGTSNHHVLVRTGPLAGQVFHLCHSDVPRTVFPSLEAFLAAGVRALEEAAFLEDLHPELSPLAPDQAGLVTFIERLLEDEGLEDLVPSFVPSLDLTDVALLERLALAENFFIAEAVALEIAKRPAAGLAQVAELCSRHGHPQVAQAGAAAVRAVGG